MSGGRRRRRLGGSKLGGGLGRGATRHPSLVLLSVLHFEELSFMLYGITYCHIQAPKADPLPQLSRPSNLKLPANLPDAC